MNSLNLLYDKLDFKNGGLYRAIAEPSVCPIEKDWIEKGEWFAAAKRAGAESIFFVDNNPVAVFAQCDGGLREKVKAFNRVWCLARPRLLFLASPGEITVYDLAQKPVNENKEEDWEKLETLDILKNIHLVSEEVQKYHRDNIESGRVFEDKRFGDLKNRADQALIRDLKSVRGELIDAGLSGHRVRFAHALIGRSIFIRYLEDRGILTKDYFINAAGQQTRWINLLHHPVKRCGLESSGMETYYPRVLGDKDFTYALFKKLAEDFNGDMFPGVEEEEKVVTWDHLKLIQDLLYGDVGVQKKLFFYSYRFDIVPLDLISSIYEEFYHISTADDEKNSKKRQDGVYYTPSVLVEFIISRILTPEVLEKKPRVLDPACGSGIFLVEAFRRIVRCEWYKNKQDLTFDQLRRILKEQIAGIEVNEEAARITAFSLYLSMLHYLEPKAIDQQIKMGNKLPNLLAKNIQSQNHFHCILPGNAFDTEFIQSNPTWKERFGAECADIIVGNPPWGAPGAEADNEAKERHQKLLDWCKSNDKTIGDKESSQAFLWRVLDFLKENGKSGVLVSAGVLFKHHKKSQTFRREWMDCVKLEEVFNFSHVREFFFKGAISPFVAMLFKKEKQGDSPVYYWSAKQCAIVKNNQSILLSKNDLRIIRNSNLTDYRIWKLFTWGSHSDREFLNYLENHPHTVLLKDETLFSCVGFKKGNQKKNADWLTKFKKLKGNAFSRYEKLDNEAFEKVPPKVECRGKSEKIYMGQRIIVSKAPRQADDANGRIDARLETESYAYNHSFHVLKLSDDAEWKYSVVIGILWSSFARYFLFLTTYFWGLWHDEVLIDERLQLPVIFDKSNPATQKIIAIAANLRNYGPKKRDLFHRDGVSGEKIEAQRKKWEADLDDAVFELYGLNEEQMDLIRDLCEVTLPFYYKPIDSIGAMPAIEKKDFSWIGKYIHSFCWRWNVYLGDEEEMRAEVHIGAYGNMIAVEFFPSDKGDPWNLEPKIDKWGHILEQIGKTLPHPMGTSQMIMDGIVQVVSNSGIIIIKRNEKRFWTRSLAREDAEATLCNRMIETMPKEGKFN
ncbi:MAG: N-6 DNA methylase [Candidatus Aminicenantes bacterium]|nr:N-6 DNA methylase [Candidatus Aminicenantes bacterium]